MSAGEQINEENPSNVLRTLVYFEVLLAVVGVGYFVLVVMLLLGKPAEIRDLLKHRLVLWEIGVALLAGVILARFLRAWYSPTPRTPPPGGGETRA